jgi:ATP dependent DNA ligase domain
MECHTLSQFRSTVAEWRSQKQQLLDEQEQKINEFFPKRRKIAFRQHVDSNLNTYWVPFTPIRFLLPKYPILIEPQLPLLPGVMDAKSYDQKRIKFKCIVQPKFDGCRIRVLRLDHEDLHVFVMSSNNIPRPKCWSSHLREFAGQYIPKGYIFEGEFYCKHDVTVGHQLKQPVSWQKLNGAFKSYKDPFVDGNLSKRPHCIYFFDIIPVTGLVLPYSKRLKMLCHIMKQAKTDKDCWMVDIIPFSVCENQTEVDEKFVQYIHMGYEGIVIRNFSGLYEAGRKSYNMMKRKPYFDDDYILEDILLIDGFLRVSCRDTATNEVFAARWDVDKPIEKYDKKQKYIGKTVVVMYHLKTEKGIPRSGKVKGIRYDREPPKEIKYEDDLELADTSK